MPEQTNEKRSALLERLARLADYDDAHRAAAAAARSDAIEAILAYFNDPEITIAYNEVRR